VNVYVFLSVVNGASPVTLDDVKKPVTTASLTDVEDHLVMETKLTIIEILKVLCFTVLAVI